MRTKRYKPSRRLKPKRSLLRKVVKNRFFWFGFLGICAAGGIVYGVFFTPYLHIQQVRIHGNEKVSTEKLDEFAKKYTQGKVLFFANTSKIAEEVKTSFPEIETVFVDTTFPSTLELTVQERKEAGVWCEEQECFALDGNGVIFERKDPVGAIVFEGQRSGAVLGDTVLQPELMEKILAFRQAVDSLALFQEVGLRISAFSVVSAERVNAKVSEGWELYFNPADRIDWQVTKAKLVLDEEVPFRKRPLLEYIDLRFGDQAYIRYKE